MIPKALLAAAAALSFATAAHAQSPCSLLTPDQIKAVVNTPVSPGKPGATDCTWQDAKGQDRVYLSLKDAKDFHDLRSQMQAGGHMTPLTGVAEDAFYVTGSAGSSAALYLLKKRHLVLLTVTGPNFSRAENEAAEKALAASLLARL